MKSLQIINKISDQEAVKLESQKVELANIKDLETLIKDLKGRFAVAENEGNILAKKLSEAEIQNRKFDKVIADMKSTAYMAIPNLVKEIQTKAKELGIDASNLPQIKEIDSLTKKTKEYEAFNKSIGTIPQI
jgi:DNA repair ATPase RecN